MARTAVRSEAIPQIANLPERVSVLEVKVDNVDQKLVELKDDVKEMHDCLDRTRDEVTTKLTDMIVEYRTNRDRFYENTERIHQEQTDQHNKLAGKISELEKFKSKWTLYSMVGLAFMAGTGWLGHVDLPKLLKFLGL